jgi:hypothetical protein
MLNALTTLIDNGLSNEAVVRIVNDLFKANAFMDNDDVRLLALLVHRAERESDVDPSIEVSGRNDYVIEVAGAGREYIVLTEEEKEEVWDEHLEAYLDDGVVDGADGPYFDREAWKRDARFDGAGHCIASYDGAEEEVDTGKAGAGWYYIYRIN